MESLAFTIKVKRRLTKYWRLGVCVLFIGAAPGQCHKSTPYTAPEQAFQSIGIEFSFDASLPVHYSESGPEIDINTPAEVKRLLNETFVIRKRYSIPFTITNTAKKDVDVLVQTDDGPVLLHDANSLDKLYMVISVSDLSALGVFSVFTQAVTPVNFQWGTPDEWNITNPEVTPELINEKLPNNFAVVELEKLNTGESVNYEIATLIAKNPVAIHVDLFGITRDGRFLFSDPKLGLTVYYPADIIRWPL